MILADHEIEQLCEGDIPLISPFRRANLQPASVDLTLDDLFLKPRLTTLDPVTWDSAFDPIDLADIDNTVGTYETHYDSFVLWPSGFVLGSTAETVALPSDLIGRVEGKSSLGRLGLSVHQTAGFLDPGFVGKITLEFANMNPRPVILRSGLKICQVSFTEMKIPARRPYGHPDLNSKYQNQVETTASRYQG